MTRAGAGALTLFDDRGQPTYHVRDPWTSKATAVAVALTAGSDRARVLLQLAGRANDVAAHPEHYDVGLTAFELAQLLRKQASTTGTRLLELVAGGMAEVAIGVDGKPVRRPTDTGRMAKAHVITAAGTKAIAELGFSFVATHAQRPPGPSKAAGRTIRRTSSRYGLTRAADRVLEELYAVAPLEGLTDTELGARIGILRTAAGTIRKQLADDGLVMATHRTRETPAKRRAIVHVITDKGRRVLLARARPQAIA